MQNLNTRAGVRGKSRFLLTCNSYCTLMENTLIRESVVLIKINDVSEMPFVFSMDPVFIAVCFAPFSRFHLANFIGLSATLVVLE